MRLRGLILIACFLVGGCAHVLRHESALTIVPYGVQPTGRILVGVTLNGRGPFRFALDTASSGTFVFASAVEQLGLEPSAEPVMTVRGAIASGRFPMVVVERLQLGSEIHEDLALTVLPGDTLATRGIDGILGADFLRRYAVEFSVREHLARLYAPETVAALEYKGFAAIALRPVRVGASVEPVWFFDVDIAGRTLPALFDLGAGLNIINRAAADALELTATREEEAVDFAGAVETGSVLARFDTQSIATGAARWRNEVFLISDLEVFETLGYGDRPLAVLGSGLFTQRDFVVDFVRNRLLIRVSMPESVTDGPDGGDGPD